MYKFLFVWLAALIGSPAFSQSATMGSAIEFEGRTIEIAPFFEEFPYSQFSVSKEGDKLFFLKTSDENRLQ